MLAALWANQAFTQTARELCDQFHETNRAEPELARRHSSAALAAATAGSPEALWSFLIAPGTPYQDRLAAADRAATLLPDSFLLRLWKAFAEADGVVLPLAERPCLQFEHRLADFLLPPQRYELLGRKLEPLTGSPPPYPVLPESRGAAPWAWQMQRAFLILRARLQARFHRDPAAYRRLLRQAWRWQPTDEHDHRVRTSAIGAGPRTQDRIRALVRLALTNPPPSSLPRPFLRPPPDPRPWAVTWLDFLPGDSPELRRSTQLALASILARAPDAETACAAAHACLNGEALLPAQLRALGRWALNPAVDSWLRYDCFANTVSRLVPDPPFAPDGRFAPESPAVRAALIRFEAWWRTRARQDGTIRLSSKSSSR